MLRINIPGYAFEHCGVTDYRQTARIIEHRRLGRLTAANLDNGLPGFFRQRLVGVPEIRWLEQPQHRLMTGPEPQPAMFPAGQPGPVQERTIALEMPGLIVTMAVGRRTGGDQQAVEPLLRHSGLVPGLEFLEVIQLQ